MRAAVGMAVAAALAGCGNEAAAPAAEAGGDVVQSAPALEAQARADTPAQSLPPSAPLLAYRYTTTLEVPARAVRPLIARHEQACAAAGPAVCQVIATHASSIGRDEVAGTLELRARPDWLRTFRAGLEAQAGEAGGRVTESGTATEDLTRSIIDTEAGLRARTTLRDRLVRLLAERPGSLEDVLQVETELARVQGEIDAQQSTLAVMRTRVATSALVLSYRSRGAPVRDGALSPIAEAGNDVVRNLAGAIGAIITLLSFAVPWALLVAGLIWLCLRLTCGARRRRAAARATKPVAPPP